MKNKNHFTRKYLPFITIVLLLTTMVFAYLYKREADLDRHDNFSFINPYLEHGHINKIDKRGYAELKSRLKDFIEEKKAKGEADLVGVWFRDLEFGPTFGINDRIDFIPASLLKLPMAITFFAFAESDPQLLNRKIVYGEINASIADQTFHSGREDLIKGKPYTIDELINRSIADSDNVASQLLYEYLEKFYSGELSNTYRDLGILEPGHDLNMAAVNTKGYGSIFRMLYNASLLNKEMSERLLNILSQSKFDKGLRQGVPFNIAIAHKFGERYLSDGSKQLHDCGIVYYPDNAYQLCIMTRGSDFNNLTGVISEISRRVYEEFDSRKIP